jgi:hypothetical protein
MKMNWYAVKDGCPEGYAIPGYCFKVAGWVECGKTSYNKLVILEKYPLVITSQW